MGVAGRRRYLTHRASDRYSAARSEEWQEAEFLEMVERLCSAAHFSADRSRFWPAHGSLPLQSQSNRQGCQWSGSSALAAHRPSRIGFWLHPSKDYGETGYVEGHNVAIEYHWAEDHYDRLPGLAVDLVRSNVDVIVAIAAAPAMAAKNATSTIPIVFAGVGDPARFGLVASLARPDGNLTGFSDINVELTPKRFELLSELVPQAKIVALLVNHNVNAEGMIGDVREAARAKGIQLAILKAGADNEIDGAFISLVELQAGALIVGDPFFLSRPEQVAALAARYAIPTIYDFRVYVAAGGLISYGTSLTDTYRNVGIYVGKILKGVKPADLPVQQPTRFELVVNLNTAKALGLTVPPSILARADEVIE